MLYTPPINTNLGVPPSSSSVSKHWATILSPSPSPGTGSQTTISSTSSPSSATPSKSYCSSSPMPCLRYRIKYLPPSPSHRRTHGEPRVLPTSLRQFNIADARIATSSTPIISSTSTRLSRISINHSHSSGSTTQTPSPTIVHSDSQQFVAFRLCSTRVLYDQ